MQEIACYRLNQLHGITNFDRLSIISYLIYSFYHTNKQIYGMMIVNSRPLLVASTGITWIGQSERWSHELLVDFLSSLLIELYCSRCPTPVPLRSFQVRLNSITHFLLKFTYVVANLSSFRSWISLLQTWFCFAKFGFTCVSDEQSQLKFLLSSGKWSLRCIVLTRMLWRKKYGSLP